MSTESLAARAWDATRNPNDPTFAAISEVGFRENLEFRAAKVQETGIANTNFEKMVAKLASDPSQKDSGPMAVVDSTVDLSGAAEGLVEKTAAEKSEIQAADKAADDETDATVEAARKARDEQRAEDAKAAKGKTEAVKDKEAKQPDTSGKK